MWVCLGLRARCWGLGAIETAVDELEVAGGRLARC